MKENDVKKLLRKDSLDAEVNEIMLYEVLSAQDDILYVGAGPLKSMLSEHLDEGVFPMPDASYYRIYRTLPGCDMEKRRRSLIEDHEEITGRKPKYNHD
jgi:hypothetical protein